MLCKAVTAFANAAGGLLVIGVKTDSAGKIIHTDGFPSTDSVDQIELRWRNILGERVEPALPHVEMRVLPAGAPTRYFGIIRLRGASPLAPHWVRNFGYHTKKKEKRKAGDFSPCFFARRGNQSRPMDIHDVRAAFGASRDATDILNELRDQRVDLYMRKRSPLQENYPAALCLMVPPRSLTEFLHADMEKSLKETGPDVWPSDFDGLPGVEQPDYMWSSDGLAFICDAPRCAVQKVYVQHFHSGAIEFCKVVAPNWVPSSNPSVDNLFWGRIMEAVTLYTGLIERISGSPSFYFGCSLVNMSQMKPAMKYDRIFGQDSFKYPIVLVRSRETVHDDLRLIRSMLAHTVGLNTDGLG